MTFPDVRLIAGIAAVAAAAAFAPALAGCSTAAKEDTSASATPAAPDATPAAHNQDDVMFAQMMIPHHEQAVELSGLVPERSTDPQVVQLAAAIAGEQQPEIDFMTATLNQWGAKPGDMNHGDMNHGGMAMSGMVDETTMTRLAGLKGPEFDTLWLQSMIAHHQGAIEMAEREVEAGRNPEMTGLARSIIAAQQAEIDRMKQLLG